MGLARLDRLNALRAIGGEVDLHVPLRGEGAGHLLAGEAGVVTDGDGDGHGWVRRRGVFVDIVSIMVLLSRIDYSFPQAMGFREYR